MWFQGKLSNRIIIFFVCKYEVSYNKLFTTIVAGGSAAYIFYGLIMFFYSISCDFILLYKTILIFKSI